MGEETEVADAHEAGGKHVEEKASQELLHGQGHEALLVAVGGVSPAEGDFLARPGHEAMVGDSDAMGVGAQVVEYILGAPEGRFAVDDPVPAEEWAQEGGESFRCGQRLQLAMEAQLALGEGAFQSGDELTAKDASQDRDGKKEAATGGEPAVVVGGESASGDHTMDMRMMLQLLVPGVEDTEEADLGAQMPGMARDFEQGLGTGAEQQIVKNLFVLQSQGCQKMRKGEDHVHVGGGQEFLPTRLQPAVAGLGLTLGTVPISTGVVRDGAIPAAGTLISMPAERGGAAALDGRQDLAVLGGQPGAAAFDEFLPRHADKIGHLQGWPVHLGASRWFLSLARDRQRQRVQGTGGGVEMAGGKVQVLGGLFQIMVT